VAAANAAKHAQLVHSMRALLAVLQQTNADVKRCADAYERADGDITEGLRGIESSVADAPLVHLAADGTGDPVGAVVGYLSRTGRPDEGWPAFDSATHLKRWLDDPANQEGAGLVKVSSRAGVLDRDLPGLARPGAVLVAEWRTPSGSVDATAFVVGADGQPHSKDRPSGQVWLSAYRPLGAGTPLWPPRAGSA